MAEQGTTAAMATEEVNGGLSGELPSYHNIYGL